MGAASVVASVCVAVFYVSENWQIPTFAWHPLLVTLGLFFLVQSILILQPTRAQAEKKLGLQWHQILILCAGLPMMTMGAWIIWHLHSLPGQKHFISWHGLLGFCIIMLLWLQVLFGASTLYWKNVFYGTESRAKAMWKYHRMSGYTLCALLLVELVLAFWEVQWMKKTGGLPLVAFTTAMVVVTSYGIANRVDLSKWGFGSP